MNEAVHPQWHPFPNDNSIRLQENSCSPEDMPMCVERMADSDAKFSAAACFMAQIKMEDILILTERYFTTNETSKNATVSIVLSPSIKYNMIDLQIRGPVCGLFQSESEVPFMTQVRRATKVSDSSMSGM